jgi:hypothetical protein
MITIQQIYKIEEKNTKWEVNLIFHLFKDLFDCYAFFLIFICVQFGLNYNFNLMLKNTSFDI